MPDKRPDWNTQEKIGLICGVSKQSIQKLCRPGKRLHDAVCKVGKDKGKVNFNHPAVQQYKQERDEKQKAKNGIISRICDEMLYSVNRRVRRYEAKDFIKDPLAFDHLFKK